METEPSSNAQKLQIRLDNAGPAGRSVTRRDTYRVDKVEQLPDGSLRIDALVTKAGVFIYHDAQGKEIREWRPPSEVKHADSVSSLQDKTVTVLHPPGLVNSTNWDQYAVGHVSGVPVPQGDGVLAKLVVNQKDAVDMIKARDLKEISCGYQLWVEETPGTTPEGEKYDAIQRDVRYNHVAMGPSDWGRQGADVCMRLDHQGNQVDNTERKKTPMKIWIHYDGRLIEVEQGSTEHNNILAKIAEQTVADKARTDAATDSARKLVTITAERDAAVSKGTDLQKRLDAAPALALETAKARLSLEAQAVSILGATFKADAKQTDRELRVLVLQKLDPDFKADGKEDLYIQAYCDARIGKAGASSAEDALRRQANLDANGNPQRQDTRDPETDEPDVEAAQKKLRKDQREMGTKNLSVTK